MDEGTVSRFGDGYGPSSTCGWVLTCSDTDANPTLTIDTIAMDDGDQLAVFDGVDNTGDQLLPGGPTNVIQAGMDAITPGPPVAESCNAHFLGGATADGFYLVSPPGWQDDPFEMYCAGGWALVATIGAPQNLVYLGDHIADGAWEPGGSEVKAHPQYAAVTGESMRVGQLVAIGTNTGNIQEINDCTAGDAACLWSHGINQNDGDQYGNWVRHGGQWQHDPGGSTDQASVAAGVDRDIFTLNRIATFGGDCPNGLPPQAPVSPCSQSNAAFTETLVDGGTISSAYGNSVDCRWTLTCSDPALAPVVTIETVRMEACCDGLSVHDGTVDDSVVWGPFNGVISFGSPAPFAENPGQRAAWENQGGDPDGVAVTTSAVVSVRVTSDGSGSSQPLGPSNPLTGFVVSYTCGPPPPPPPSCTTGASFTETLVDGGTIATNEYGNSVDCRWLLTCSDPAEVPLVTFESVGMEAGFDQVNAHNGATETDATLYSGTGFAPSLPATAWGDSADGMLLRLTSDGSGSTSDYGAIAIGFSASWTCTSQTPIAPEEVCAGRTDVNGFAIANVPEGEAGCLGGGYFQGDGNGQQGEAYIGSAANLAECVTLVAASTGTDVNGAPPDGVTFSGTETTPGSCFAEYELEPAINPNAAPCTTPGGFCHCVMGSVRQLGDRFSYSAGTENPAASYLSAQQDCGYGCCSYGRGCPAAALRDIWIKSDLVAPAPTPAAGSLFIELTSDDSGDSVDMPADFTGFTARFTCSNSGATNAPSGSMLALVGGVSNDARKLDGVLLVDVVVQHEIPWIYVNSVKLD